MSAPLLLVVAVLLNAAGPASADDLGQWLQSENVVARTKLLNNILPSGSCHRIALNAKPQLLLPLGS